MGSRLVSGFELGIVKLFCACRVLESLIVDAMVENGGGEKGGCSLVESYLTKPR